MSINTEENKSICAYPWKHSYIGSRYERKLCCVAQDVPEYEKQPTSEFWNSDYMRDVRLKMIKGEPVKECYACYEKENVGITSLRKISFDRARQKKLYEAIENTKEDGSVDSLPDYFDYRTIHCNLQCVSCGDVFSSQHMILMADIFPNYKNSFRIDYEFENDMAEEIITALRERRLDKIYWAGGEPMMSHIHWKVVEEMENIRKEDPEYFAGLFVHYNTNMTRLYWKGQLIPDLISFYQPSIQASLDGTHETFEFCRDGASWEEVSHNFKIYQSKLNEDKQFSIASVLSSPVLMDIDRWFDFYEPYDPYLFNHKLADNNKRYLLTTYQGFLDIRFFPEKIFNRVVDHALDRFEKSNLRGKQGSIDILNAYKIEKAADVDQMYENPEYHRKLKKQTLIRDTRRKTNRTYGELLQIIDLEAYEWYNSIEVEL